ncbi:hypothetical protein GCM10025868_39870 [Angustibacter aerolatus]|uniref:Uncharacterized protein n=1 Tax=Angustibacter aerolatus TaxID=1162965 RepID=A0ABQ6JKG7_9ACTN|nr:hypothetical protein GCM10025868_39870 [Angustibacter aerolatus]
MPSPGTTAIETDDGGWAADGCVMPGTLAAVPHRGRPVSGRGRYRTRTDSTFEVAGFTVLEPP